MGVEDRLKKFVFLPSDLTEVYAKLMFLSSAKLQVWSPEVFIDFSI